MAPADDQFPKVNICNPEKVPVRLADWFVSISRSPELITVALGAMNNAGSEYGTDELKVDIVANLRMTPRFAVSLRDILTAVIDELPPVTQSQSLTEEEEDLL